MKKLYQETLVRVDAQNYFLNMAELVSMRGTCARRQVGCILVDKNNLVLATGYNGNPRGHKHCTDSPCKGAKLKGTGLGLDVCEAIHAEQNALLQCKDVDKIKTAYITVSPCMTCVKLLLNTSCEEIVFMEEYIDNNNPKRMWQNGKRKWTHAGTVI